MDTEAEIYSVVMNMEPTIVIKGSVSLVKDAYLVIQKEVLYKIPEMNEVVLILLASFYVFNMHYTKGFSNLFMYLEYHIMGRPVPRDKTKVHNFLAQLTHVI